jgi:hypothetical protein
MSALALNLSLSFPIIKKIYDLRLICIKCDCAKVNHSAPSNKRNISFYFEDCLYKYKASIPKIKLASQAAMKALKFPFNANTEANLPTKI